MKAGKMKMVKLNFNSIRTRLIISLVAICVIPLIVLGVISYNKSKSVLNKKLQVNKPFQK